MKSTKLLKCPAQGCPNHFTREVRSQKFCSAKCKNTEAQRRYRERQKATA